MAGHVGGLTTPEEVRNEIKLVVDYIPENKLYDALIAMDNFLEFNEQTQKDLMEAMDLNNLLGPYSSFEEMMQDALTCEDDE